MCFPYREEKKRAGITTEKKRSTSFHICRDHINCCTVDDYNDDEDILDVEPDIFNDEQPDAEGA
jgi:hypothetical protein